VLCAIWASFLSSCKHEPIEPPVVVLPVVEPCVDYDSLLNECIVGPFYNDLSPSYYFPTINPNNPNEFAYYSDKKVYKYNMDTKTSTLLAEDIWVIDRMDWGAKGWIAFSTINWKVWILKDDGSSMKQISFTPRDLYPEFNSSGNTLTYSRHMEYSVSELENNPTLYERYRSMLVDIESNSVDSFDVLFGVCSWNSTNSIAAIRAGVEIYKHDTKIHKPFIADNSIADIPDIEWLPDNENILFITRYGNNQGTIYKVNSVTDELNMVKEGCENRFYNDLAISPDGTFMLAQKGTAVVEDCDINTTWQIVKMDLDGNNEEVIDLSE
jgi:hypothetical protein